jgi:hypothetical protein
MPSRYGEITSTVIDVRFTVTTRASRWLELIKDYDIRNNYHLGKANAVADDLSRKRYCNATLAIGMRPKLRQESGYLIMAMVNETAMAIEMEPTLEAEIRKG